jgi:hypothetical protein
LAATGGDIFLIAFVILSLTAAAKLQTHKHNLSTNSGRCLKKKQEWMVKLMILRLCQAPSAPRRC